MTKAYRLSPESMPMSPEEDFIGLNFSPRNVVLDNIGNLLHVKRQIELGVYAPDAPISRDYDSIELKEFVERIRTMVYDPEENRTLEAAIGGGEKFDQAVATARLRELQRHAEPYDFWVDVCTSDSVFES